MVYVIFGNRLEEIEALAPVDLLRRAGADVVTVGIGAHEITTSRGVKIVADITDAEMKTDGLEMIVLPGGVGGTDAIMHCENVRRVVRYAYDNDKWVCAICAAPTVLGEMGLLQGKRAVCYPGNESLLTGAILEDAEVVTDGKIITGRAAGASISFALKLVEALKGAAEAENIRRKILYR